MLPHYFNTKTDFTQAFLPQKSRKSCNFLKNSAKYFGVQGKKWTRGKNCGKKQMEKRSVWGGNRRCKRCVWRGRRNACCACAAIAWLWAKRGARHRDCSRFARFCALFSMVFLGRRVRRKRANPHRLRDVDRRLVRGENFRTYTAKSGGLCVCFFAGVGRGVDAACAVKRVRLP